MVIGTAPESPAPPPTPTSASFSTRTASPDSTTLLCTTSSTPANLPGLNVHVALTAASAIAASTAMAAPVTSSSNDSIRYGTIAGPSSASRWYATTVGRRVGVATLW